MSNHCGHDSCFQRQSCIYEPEATPRWGAVYEPEDAAPKQADHIEEADRPFIVCPTCKGHGHHGPGHVYTQDDLDEQFGPDQYDVMQDYRDGKYDVTCTECKGARVVKGECPCADCEQDREYAREAAAEAAYFARMGM